MNIFVPYADARWSAHALDDKRLVKMVLETAQMLSTVCGGPYKATHKNHPCTRWVGETRGNYEWTLSLFFNLCDDYTYRFGKVHKCAQYSTRFLAARGRMPEGKRTAFADCSGFGTGDVHKNYRACLNHKWATDKREPKWTRRQKPDWADYYSDMNPIRKLT